MTTMADEAPNPYQAMLEQGGRGGPSASSFIRARLSLMMFLEFFIWGAWYPLIFGYLPAINFDNDQQFWVLAGFNVAAIVAMFFSTQFADRNFAAERFLAGSQLVGGIAMLALSSTTSFWPLLIFMYLHCLC